MKLKLRLWTTYRTLHMQVLEQVGIRSSEHVEIKDFPQILKRKIRLKGTESKFNDYIANRYMQREKNAKQYKEEIVGWLNEMFQPSFIVGEYIYVKNKGDKRYKKRMFLTFHSTGGVVVVRKEDEKSFLNKGKSRHEEYAEIRNPSSYNESTGIFYYSDEELSEYTDEIDVIVEAKDLPIEESNDSCEEDTENFDTIKG